MVVIYLNKIWKQVSPETGERMVFNIETNFINDDNEIGRPVHYFRSFLPRMLLNISERNQICTQCKKICQFIVCLDIECLGQQLLSYRATKTGTHKIEIAFQ